MERRQNPCLVDGVHDNEYMCSKCGTYSIDGEDIRFHERHMPLSCNNIYDENKKIEEGNKVNLEIIINNNYLENVNSNKEKKN